MKTYAEQMQAIVTQYIDAGETWPASTHEIAAWEIRTKRWEPPHSSMVGMCADQIARALREEYITDPQGRRMRAKHAARVRRHDRQITLWADIRNADRHHMEIAFQQRRQQIVGDCAQLKRDVDSFNDNRCKVDPIQMVFDFTQDLAEIEALERESASAV